MSNRYKYECKYWMRYLKSKVEELEQLTKKRRWCKQDINDVCFDINMAQSAIRDELNK